MAKCLHKKNSPGQTSLQACPSAKQLLRKVVPAHGSKTESPVPAVRLPNTNQIKEPGKRRCSFFGCTVSCLMGKQLIKSKDCMPASVLELVSCPFPPGANRHTWPVSATGPKGIVPCRKVFRCLQMLFRLCEGHFPSRRLHRVHCASPMVKSDIPL